MLKLARNFQMTSRKKSGVASGIPFKTNSRFSRTAGQSPGLIHPVMPFLTNWLENTFQLFNNKFYLTFWRSVKPVGYSRSGEVAALVMSFIGLPIRNHFSPITLRRASLAQGGPLTFHQSPPLPFSLLTNHFSPLTAAPAVLRSAGSSTNLPPASR